jgi:flagellar motility protein MotE (MotC chaperone)
MTFSSPFRRSPLSAALLAGALLVAGLQSAAAEGGGKEPVGPPTTPAKLRVIGSDGTEASVPVQPVTDVQRYCANIADPALDARNALQLAKVKEAEDQLTARIAELEAKRKEVETWLASRKEFIDSTSETMIQIYSGMKPDAAAGQLAGMERPAAASLLARLKSRQASAILAEMPAPVAAELANIITQKTDRAAQADNAGAAPAAGGQKS